MMQSSFLDPLVDFGDEPPQSPTVQLLIETVANVELGDHPLKLTTSLDALPSLPPLPDGSFLKNSTRITRRSLFGGDQIVKKVSSADPDFEPSGVMRRTKSDFGTCVKLAHIRKCPETTIEAPGTKRFMLRGSMDSLPLAYTSSEISIKITPADEPEVQAKEPVPELTKHVVEKEKMHCDLRLHLSQSDTGSPSKARCSPLSKRKPLKPIVNFQNNGLIKKSSSNSQLQGIMEIPHESAAFEFCPPTFIKSLPLHEPPLISSLSCELKGGLQYIKPSTVSGLIAGDIQLGVKFLIIDCRWTYEYTGGHIGNAVNIFKEEDMVSFFFENPPQFAFEEKVILIFHCEFSSHRAPKMVQAVRNRDRLINSCNYPKLYYPELYVIEGGYKAFFEGHPVNCQPSKYVPMDAPAFAEDAKKFNVLLHKKSTSKPKRSMSSNCILSLTRRC